MAFSLSHLASPTASETTVPTRPLASASSTKGVPAGRLAAKRALTALHHSWHWAPSSGLPLLGSHGACSTAMSTLSQGARTATRRHRSSAKATQKCSGRKNCFSPPAVP